MRGDERSEKLPHQTHAVFNLREALVVILIRDIAPGDAQHFVRGENELAAAQIHKPILPFFADGQHFLGLFLGVGAQRIKMLAELGQPHGHQRGALRGGMQGKQRLQGILQHRAVVNAGAQHDLAVELDAVLFKLPQPGQQLCRVGVLHHFDAHGRISGVNGDEQRAGPAAQDAVKLLIVHIGQRDKVAHHQRHAPVVILDIQRLAAGGRHLIDEAEHALVFAYARGARHAFAKVQPQGNAGRLDQLQLPVAAVRLTNVQDQVASGRQRLIIDLVDDLLAVDGQQGIALAQAVAQRRAARLHMRNQMLQGTCSSILIYYRLIRRDCQERAALLLTLLFFCFLPFLLLFLKRLEPL